ncbi:MAG: hypothetical protein WCG55_02675 [bacterium]
MNIRSSQQNTERGAAMMIAVIFFILASVLLVLGLSAPAAREYRIGLDAITSRQSLAAGESGVEDGYYRLKNGMHLGSSTSFFIGNVSASTTITNIGGGVEEVVGTGNSLGDQRSSTLRAVVGSSVPLHYAVMSDDGGIDMSDTSSVTGDVHADKELHGQDGVSISGTATVGNSAAGAYGVVRGDDAAHQIHVGVGSVGNVYAHTVNYTNATGILYCTLVLSSSGPCSPYPDPVYTELPISSTDISTWETDAASGGVISGSYSVSTAGVTLGPKKINGDLIIPDSANLTLSGVLWVTGNLTITGSGSINLSSSFGSNSSMIIVDGTITTSAGSHIVGSGTPGSYVLLLSNSTSSSAITYRGTGSAVVYARQGTAILNGSASASFVAGQTVHLFDTSSVVYDSALLGTVFVTGASTPPAILSWRETN